MSFLKKLFTYCQYFLPHHALSNLVGWFAESRISWLKNFFIYCFIRHYSVDMSLAEIENPYQYENFNQFFVRLLKSQLRPISTEAKDIVSPVDGTIFQLGQIHQNQLIQVKKIYFNLETLLGNQTTLANRFYDGQFMICYLAPHNYHRVHMPLSGQLLQSIYIPGRLFSVNQMTSQLIPRLYSRNERWITIFKTEAGLMAVILVGAMIVGSIQAAWLKKPFSSRNINETLYEKSFHLDKGNELGQFKLGSTVIILFEKNKMNWHTSLNNNPLIQFGQSIGKVF